MKKYFLQKLSIIPVAMLALGIAAFFTTCEQLPEVQKTPVSGDYNVVNLNQTAESVTPVTITAKEGKSPGAVGNIKYNNSATLPQTAGTYAVTFDVAAATGWNVATGLYAGILTVAPTTGGNLTPAAGDYTFAKRGQTAGSVTAVTITAKEGKSPGAVGNIRYDYSIAIPQAAGTYAVIFDVAAAAGWNAASSLIAGILTVYAASPSNKTPIASDYDIAKLGQTAGSVTAVTITAKEDKSPGAVSNIRYAGSTTIPQTAGTYAVTFDVDAATGWNIATGLSAGNLTVNAVGDTTQTPVSGDYTFDNLNQTPENVTAVTITAKADKSPGVVSNIRYTGSTAIPQTAGTYAVTFDVAAATGWYAVTGLSAGILTVSVLCTHNGAEYLPGNHQTLPHGAGCTCKNIPGTVVNTIPVTNRSNLTSAVFSASTTAVSGGFTILTEALPVIVPIVKSHVGEISVIPSPASPKVSWVKKGSKYVVSIEEGATAMDIANGLYALVVVNELAPEHCACSPKEHDEGTACCLDAMKAGDCSCTIIPFVPPMPQPCDHNGMKFLPGNHQQLPMGADCTCENVPGAVRLIYVPITNYLGIPDEAFEAYADRFQAAYDDMTHMPDNFGIRFHLQEVRFVPNNQGPDPVTIERLDDEMYILILKESAAQENIRDHLYQIGEEIGLELISAGRQSAKDTVRLAMQGVKPTTMGV